MNYLMTGVYLVVPTERRFVEERYLSSWNGGTLPTKTEWGEFDYTTPQRGKRWWSQTTIEDIQRLPCWLREAFLPVLLGGGQICVLPTEGIRYPNEKEDDKFWIKVTFPLISG